MQGELFDVGGDRGRWVEGGGGFLGFLGEGETLGGEVVLDECEGAGRE